MARTTSLTPAQRRRRASTAANTGRPARRAGAVRRDTSPGTTTWTKVAVILNVIAAALNLGTATLHARPASPLPTAVVVIYASHCPATPAPAPSNARPTRQRKLNLGDL